MYNQQSISNERTMYLKAVDKSVNSTTRVKTM